MGYWRRVARVARFYSGLDARALEYGELVILDNLRGIVRKEEAWQEHELTPAGVEEVVREVTGDADLAARERAKAELVELRRKDR